MWLKNLKEDTGGNSFSTNENESGRLEIPWSKLNHTKLFSNRKLTAKEKS